MTKEQLAAKLNGREYREEITNAEMAIAKSWGLVVVFGGSDDLLELRGAISDEIGSYGGKTIHVNKDGLLVNECDDEDCPYFEKLKENAAIIETLWCDEGEYSWTYKTDIPHATFEIVDEGEPYCRGIVFELADVKERN